MYVHISGILDMFIMKWLQLNSNQAILRYLSGDKFIAIVFGQLSFVWLMKNSNHHTKRVFGYNYDKLELY